MSPQPLPAEHKAQVLEEFGKPYVLKNCPIPSITSSNEILVKVEAAGYCHTDAVLAAGQNWGGHTPLPHIGSHEFAGTVVALPDQPSQAAQNLSLGTRVGVPGRGFDPCGSCFECQDPTSDEAGYSFFCEQGLSNGLSRDGGFAEYALVDARQVVPLPESISCIDAAPLMCAGITIYSAIKRCGLREGQRLGIIGCGGGLGHLGLQFADALGYRVTGVDAADGPLELARSLETRATIIDARTMTAEAVLQEIGKEDQQTERANTGLDAVIILPETQSGFDFGVKLLRNHGTCVAVSIPEKGWHVSAFDLVFRDIKLIGSMLGTKSTLQEMVDFAAKHNIKAVKKAYALGDLNTVVADHHEGLGGRQVIDMSM